MLRGTFNGWRPHRPGDQHDARVLGPGPFRHPGGLRRRQRAGLAGRATSQGAPQPPGRLGQGPGGPGLPSDRAGWARGCATSIAGLAIPDFPALGYGGVVHYLLPTGWRLPQSPPTVALRRGRLVDQRRDLVIAWRVAADKSLGPLAPGQPAWVLLGAIAAQFLLGACVVWTQLGLPITHQRPCAGRRRRNSHQRAGFGPAGGPLSARGTRWRGSWRRRRCVGPSTATG